MSSRSPVRSDATSPGRRGLSDGSLGRALAFLLVFGVLLGIVQLGAGYVLSDPYWPVCLFTAVFWVWLAAGLLAWWRRPGNGIGQLIIVGAIAICLGGLANVPAPLLVQVNAVFATSVLAVTVHILHAFPSGRLRGRLSVTTVVSAYVVAVGFDLVLAMLPPTGPGDDTVLEKAQTALGLLVMLVTAVVLARRLVVADRRHRRILLPMFAYGILAVLLVPLIPPVVRATDLPPAAAGVAQLALLAGLPIAFLLGVLLGGFRRTTAIEPLSAWLAIGGADRPAVGRALASTLGDDSLQVAYWVPDRQAYVDESGVDVPAAHGAPDRGWVEVRVDDRLVGAIGYDRRLVADPSTVRRAGDVLAIAIDRERLTAELLASNDQLARSRLRLVEAAFRERSRIARDLHDGLQVQLVLLALEAQTIANAPGTPPSTSAAAEHLRRGIDAAAADLRGLVHNVLPATLVEQGLAAAAEDLVDRLAIPATFSADIDEVGFTEATTHTAYFVLAELLANAVKHSRASEVSIRLDQVGDRLVMDVRDDGVGNARVDGHSGLRGLMDRVNAIDGIVEIDSRSGHGTRVRVELPCG